LTNILSANTVSSKAKTGTVIGKFSHAGASGGQYILDAEAQVFFSVNANNQLVWSPAAGISLTRAFIRSMCQRSSRGTTRKTASS
jgi:hypothetical protein